MLRNLVAAWSIPDVRQRIVYVFMMFGLFVIGLHIPVPGVNLDALKALIQQNAFLNLFDTFSGSAFRRFTIFALGITPYINASIIMQLMTVAVPHLEALQKEGESGRKTIAKYTRWGTVALAIVQAAGIITLLSNSGGGAPIFTGGLLTKIQVLIALTAGTMFLLWIGESITEKGVGQGVSLIIFVSIMARLPYDVRLTAQAVSGGGVQAVFGIVLLLALFLATVVGIIYVQDGTRRIPIQHAKQRMGQAMARGGGQSSFLPFKVNAAGVMPIIFAISLLMFPATVSNMALGAAGPNTWQGHLRLIIQNWTTPGENQFASLLYFVLIMGFTYSYSAIVFNIPELTENLKKYGSFVPGIRPGRPTQEYLDRVLTRITFAGAVFLGIIGLIQYYIPKLTGIHTFTLVGGTSLLIVVGVGLDTMQNLEAHLTMRNYEGFIRQTGRRRGGAGAGLSLR